MRLTRRALLGGALGLLASSVLGGASPRGHHHPAPTPTLTATPTATSAPMLTPTVTPTPALALASSPTPTVTPGGTVSGVNFPRVGRTFATGTASNPLDWWFDWIHSRIENESTWATDKTNNANALILAYLDAPSSAYPSLTPSDVPTGNALPSPPGTGSITTSWVIYDKTGTPIQHDFGNGLPVGQQYVMDPTQYCPTVSGKVWRQWIVDWAITNHLSSDSADGLFFDDCDAMTFAEAVLHGTNGVDLDRNGSDDWTEHGAAWIHDTLAAGWRQMFAYANQQLLANSKPNGLVVPNGWGTSTYPYYDVCSGHLNEGWNNPISGDSQWNLSFADLQLWEPSGYTPYAGAVTPPDNGTTDATAYQKLRFFLCCALMTDSFFYYSYSNSHQWYDEFSVNLATGVATGDQTHTGYLGQPLGGYSILANGVYRRDFQNGVVLMNPTGASQTVTLEKAYQKISGTQANPPNDGTTVTSVTLGAGTMSGTTQVMYPSFYGDGLILLGNPSANVPVGGGGNVLVLPRRFLV